MNGELNVKTWSELLFDAVTCNMLKCENVTCRKVSMLEDKLAGHHAKHQLNVNTLA